MIGGQSLVARSEYYQLCNAGLGGGNSADLVLSRKKEHKGHTRGGIDSNAVRIVGAFHCSEYFVREELVYQNMWTLDPKVSAINFISQLCYMVSNELRLEGRKMYDGMW